MNDSSHPYKMYAILDETPYKYGSVIDRPVSVEVTWSVKCCYHRTVSYTRTCIHNLKGDTYSIYMYAMLETLIIKLRQQIIQNQNISCDLKEMYTQLQKKRTTYMHLL